MKKLIIIGLVAAFTFACTTPDVNEELTEYGTDKDKSVTTKGDSQDFEHDNSED